MKKGLKVALFVGAPLLVLGAGGVVAAAMLGYLDIAGLTQKERAKAPPPTVAVVTKSEKPKPPAILVRNTPPPKSAVPRVTVTTPDPVRGDRRLARLWNELEPTRLIEISKDWREEDLARVMLRMDTGVVAEMIATMPDAKKASSLSRRIRQLASLPPPKEE
ncbi:MAG: hypothetical protein KIS66_06455 [Fimbriimonadaceae bacterium]|nr:hypothetical protein [Fimbriimonadaceae bacterium]